MCRRTCQCRKRHSADVCKPAAPHAAYPPMRWQAKRKASYSSRLEFTSSGSQPREAGSRPGAREVLPWQVSNAGTPATKRRHAVNGHCRKVSGRDRQARPRENIPRDGPFESNSGYAVDQFPRRTGFPAQISVAAGIEGRQPEHAAIDRMQQPHPNDRRITGIG